MPIFEFNCRKCDHVFEEILTLAELEAGDLKCPACGSKRVQKALSTFATGSGGADTPCGAPPGSCGAGGFT